MLQQIYSTLNRRKRIFLAALLFSAGAVCAQVVVDAKLDRAEILIGEQAKLSATVTAGARQRVAFPDYAAGDTLTSGIEVLKGGPVDTVWLNGKQRMKLTRDYIITSFDSALYALPPLPVKVDGKTHLSRSRLGLKVGTVPVDTVHVDRFMPPYDVAESPYIWDGKLAGLSFIIFAFVALVFVFAVRLSDKKPIRRRVVIKPPIPPYKKAAGKMKEMETQISRADSMVLNKAFYVKLTDTIRVYIMERFGFNATEKTTQEILDGLYGEIDDTDARRLRELFTAADFVKFAKHSTGPDERQYSFRIAADFLSSTRDETMERPKPEIRMVTYSDARQHKLRLLFWGGLAVSTIGCAAWFVWMVYELWATYL